MFLLKFVTSFLGTVLLGSLLLLPWVRLNLSSSLPRGLYRLDGVPATLVRGTLVVVPAPAIIRPWYTALAPLLKPVAGVAGDVLTVTDARFYVNATDYGPMHHQADGRPLPLVPVPLVVPPGEVCLASPAPRSLDCRYMGLTRIVELRATATPLWVWE